MASGKTVGSLYLSLGLDVSELEQGFALADRTVSQAIAKFRQESKDITLKADADTANAETAIEKLTIRYKALGEQIKLSREQELLFRRNYEASLKEFGADSKITANAKTAMLRQEVVTAQMLERQRNMKAAIDASSSSMLKFADAIKAARGGAMSLLNYVTMLAPELAAATAVLTAGLGLAALTKEAADAAASIGDLGDNLGITTKEAAELQGTLKAANVGVDGFVSWMTKLDKSIKTAGEGGNEATRTLERFGASLTDSEGNLLSYNEQLRQLAKAYQNAKSVGKVEDFFAGLGGSAQQFRDLFNKFESEYGRRGSGYYSKALQEAAPAAMELTDRLNEVNEELDAIKLAFGAAFIPVASEMLPPIAEKLREILEYLDENKEQLFEFADAVKRSVGTVLDLSPKLQLDPLDMFGKGSEALKRLTQTREEIDAIRGGGGGKFTMDADTAKAERALEQQKREAKTAADAELKAQKENAEAIAEIWRKATGSKLENDLAAIDARMKKELEAANLTEQAKARIQERYAAERQVAIMKASQEVERMDRELSDSIAKQTKGELENALRDIDRQAEATRKKYLDLYGSVSAKTDELIQKNADLQRQNALQSRADKALTSEKKYWDLFQQAMNGGMVSETFRNGVKMYTMTGNLSREERLQVAEDAIRKAMLKERGIDSANVRTSDLLPFDAIMKKLQGGGLANIVDDAGVIGDKVGMAVQTALSETNAQMADGMNTRLAPALERMQADSAGYQSAALGQYEAIRQSVDALAARMGDRDAVAPVITVQIDSAVTEDSASMTRLADTVADRINEVLVRYIGDSAGGTNTY